MTKTRAVVTYLLIATSVAVLDLWTKVAAFDFLGAVVSQPEPGNPVLTWERDYEVFSWFHLEASINLGAFSGWFYGMRTLLLLISAGWVVGTLGWVCWKRRNEALLVVAIALTAGGAFGNLWDRYFHYSVRDFIKWFVVIGEQAHVWPNFNIADSCIVSGVVLILIREYKVARATKQLEAAPAE